MATGILSFRCVCGCGYWREEGERGGGRGGVGGRNESRGMMEE